jgi:flagellar protein FlgJ
MMIDKVRPAVIPKEEDEKLKDVARQFEAVFLNQLIGAMRETVPHDGFLPPSHAEKIYQGMLDSEYATQIAETETIGLSRVIYEQLLRSRNGG